MAEPIRVAFIGLGVMGYPMAGHLARAGLDVTVFNRTRARADQWEREFGGHVAATPRLAGDGADVVFTCVGNDDDVRAVTLGSAGVLPGMRPRATLVDHTTASPELARELALVAASADVSFLDAPVSGGQQGAEQGRLTIMAGGDPAAFERVRRVVGLYARAVTLMGPAGSGQLTKMVNQICIAGILQGLAEGLHFAERAGLDAGLVVDVISQGAAQSWQMDNRARTMLEERFDFGFAVDWMRKDLAIALHTAREIGAPLPLAALVDQLYGEVQARGGGRWDTSSLIQRQRASGQRRSSGT
jgi:3-hydroxyisobutyrate dehydrogenase-like beta-hydroxyacid dehydrogenase